MRRQSAYLTALVLLSGLVPPSAQATLAYVRGGYAYTADDDGTTPIRHGRAIGVRLSLDGSHLALRTAGARAQIVRLSDRQTRTLAIPNVNQLAWASRSRLIVASSAIDAAQIWRVDGRTRARLIHSVRRECGEPGCDFPSVRVEPSPDGALIAVYLPLRWALTVIRPSGAIVWRRAGGSMQVSDTGWAPDSSALVAVEQAVYSDGRSLVRYSRGGTRRLLRRVTPLIIEPSLSPAGQIAYGVLGDDDTYSLKVLTGQRVQSVAEGVTVTGMRLVGPWRSDTTLLAAFAGAVHSIDTTTGTTSPLVETRGDFDWVASPLFSGARLG